MIDFQAHAFVDNLADRAIASISAVSSDSEPSTGGTLDGLLNSMAENGVEHAVLLNIATRPTQPMKRA